MPKADVMNTKICSECGQVLPLKDFYVNKQWEEQKGRDKWCTACAKRQCFTKEKQQRYLHENNRAFSPGLWQRCEKRVTTQLCADDRYVKASTEEKTRQMASAISQMYLRNCNMPAYYKYEEHDECSSVDEAVRQEAQRIQRTIDTQPDLGDYDQEDEQSVYSMKFGGWFKKREIRWQEDYYARMAETFDLTDPNTHDYCVKNAVASLVVNNAADEYRRGKIQLKEYKDAMSVYDMTSKSANFAACKRKAEEKREDIGSLGELIALIEGPMAMEFQKVQFEPDDIDRVQADYRHAIRAADGEGLLG